MACAGVCFTLRSGSGEYLPHLQTAKPLELESKKTSIQEPMDDSIQLQLPKEFVQTVVDCYGEQPGCSINGLTDEDRTVTLSSEMQFNIFRYLYIGVEKNEIQAEEEAAVAASSPSKKSDEDLEFEAILRKIKDLNATENDFMIVQHPQNENHGEFRRILKEDALKSQQEWLQYQMLISEKLSMSQNIRIYQIRKCFPTLSSKIVEDIFRQRHCDYDEAMKSLYNVYPSKYVPLPKKLEVKPVEPSRSFSGNEDTYDPVAVAQMSPQEKRTLLEEAAEWRKRADELATAWEDAREKAARQRSVKSAYSLYIVEAVNFKHKASQALEKYWYFTLLSLNAGNKNPNKIDLHGLGVNKAKEIVQKYLHNRKTWAMNNMSENSNLNVTIITGQGRHSMNNVPKLNPAIRKYLIDNHYSFTEGDCVGSFNVQISAKEERKPNNQAASGSKGKSK